MALNFDYYGNADGDTPAERIAEATNYFAQRLHETAWSAANDADREKALIAARGIIDALNYKGVKHSVYTLCGSSDRLGVALDGHPGRRGEPALGVSPRRRHRGARGHPHRRVRDRLCPLGRQRPELELENLAISAMGYGTVKTTYERAQLPIEHIINMVPSSVAWRLLKPFLRRLGRLASVTNELGRVSWLPFTGTFAGSDAAKNRIGGLSAICSIRAKECSHVPISVSVSSVGVVFRG